MPLSVLCPFCAKPNSEEAFRCPHCHAWLVPFTFRHKWLQGLLGIGVAIFLIYDGAKDRFLTDLPGWLLITTGILLGLYGLFHLFRSPRAAFEDGRKELFKRYQERVPEPDDENDEDDD